MLKIKSVYLNQFQKNMFLLQHKEKMSVQLFIRTDVQHTAPDAVAIKAALPQLT